MDRKYRQRGYQDDQRDQPRERPKQKADQGFGAKPPTRIETRFTDVIRCSNCSAIVETMGGNVAFTDQCKKCNSDLHSCKNCSFFDPGARFECQKPIEARVAKKGDRNMCMQFAMKVSVEKQQPKEIEGKKEVISSGRKAFEDLFKK
jgi:hypothetical protein